MSLKLNVAVKAYDAITDKDFLLPAELQSGWSFKRLAKKVKAYFEGLGFGIFETYHHDVYIAKRPSESIVICLHDADEGDFGSRILEASGPIVLSDWEKSVISQGLNLYCFGKESGLNGSERFHQLIQMLQNGVIEYNHEKTFVEAILRERQESLGAQYTTSLRNLRYAIRNPKVFCQGDYRVDILYLREQRAQIDLLDARQKADFLLLRAWNSSRSFSTAYPVMDLKSALDAFLEYSRLSKRDAERSKSLSNRGTGLEAITHTFLSQVNVLTQIVASLQARSGDWRTKVDDRWDLGDAENERVTNDLLNQVRNHLMFFPGGRELEALLKRLNTELDAGYAASQAA